MAKFIWIGVGVLLLGGAVGGYVLNNGAPPIPKGACPAAVSLAPYDADVVAYADFNSLRSAVTKEQMDALARSASAAAYNQFGSATNFQIERDLDHIMLAASVESSLGAWSLMAALTSLSSLNFSPPPEPASITSNPATSTSTPPHRPRVRSQSLFWDRIAWPSRAANRLKLKCSF